ncbi:MAG: hypothetical protein ACYDB4_20025 [Candidatus Dormibacteraceae bacterium]
MKLQALAAPKPIMFGLAGAAVAGTIMGVPTAVIVSPIFGRMTPVRPQDYVFLAVNALLIGLIAATFGLPKASTSCQTRTVGGGFLSTLAIGCPVCNHVVVALLGVSGALAYWAPIQPVLGAAAIVLLLWTLRRRLQRVAAADSELVKV